ncbi:MAG: hypothetical protein ABFC77_01480 [Thermoguttaceae bacterium]
MEEQAVTLNEASVEYVGRWNRLVSTTNWEKGRIIFEWRESLKKSDSPAGDWTDEVWSRQVGNVTPQHVGRLRRVFERFGAVHDQYRGLFWSHFHAAVDWADAEMYLQGAVESGWSVAEMRRQRWEANGGDPAEQVAGESADDVPWDEDTGSDAEASLPEAITETFGEVHDADDSTDDESEYASSDESSDAAMSESPTSVADATSPVRPFESLPALPPDLQEGFELLKLAILSHKVLGWSEIARDDVLAMLESLRQLALAPAE